MISYKQLICLHHPQKFSDQQTWKQQSFFFFFFDMCQCKPNYTNKNRIGTKRYLVICQQSDKSVK